MRKFDIVFKGYRRDVNLKGMPEYSGIYMVYLCKYNKEKNTVSLDSIIYIGQASNLKERIENHDKRDRFQLCARKKGLELCYSYAHVDESDLAIVENALIFAQKPELNDRLKDNFNFDSVQIRVEGQCRKLTYTDYTIE